MFSDEYKTVEVRAEAEISDRGSKFTGVIVPADSPEKAEVWLAKLKDEFSDAADYVFALRVGLQESRVVASGGNERTAAVVARILESEDLTNVLLAVFRRAQDSKDPSEQAYRDAAANAVRRAKVVTRILFDVIRFQIPRDELESISRLITDNRGKVIQTVTDPEFVISVKIRKLQSEDLKRILITSTHGRVRLA